MTRDYESGESEEPKLPRNFFTALLFPANLTGLAHIGIYTLCLLFLGLVRSAMIGIAGIAVGFVGLIVPHMLRLLGVRDHRLLLPASALLGGSLLIIADTLARTLLAPRQLPVGILTALVGVPLFLMLLHHGRSLHGGAR